MLTPQFSEFVDAHRWAVLTTLSASGAPSSSVVAYAREGQSFVISTPGATFKRRSIQADPRVNLCVLTNSEPFNFVALQGLAVIETQGETQTLQASTKAVFANLEGTGWALPEDLDAWLVSQDRVIIRVTPEHVHGVMR
jgi:PPOX class probable F420-dependent enzyme